MLFHAHSSAVKDGASKRETKFTKLLMNVKIRRLSTLKAQRGDAGLLTYMSSYKEDKNLVPEKTRFTKKEPPRYQKKTCYQKNQLPNNQLPKNSSYQMFPVVHPGLL